MQYVIEVAVPTNVNYLDNKLTIVGKYILKNTHFTPFLEYSGRIKDTHIKNEVMEVLEEKNTEYLCNVVMWKTSKPNTKCRTHEGKYSSWSRVHIILG